VRLLLVAGIAVTLVLEALRLLAGLEWVVYDKLTREYEQDNLAGYALYVIGGSLVGLVFDPTIAVPAMLMLTIGDPISGLLGSDELRTMKRPRVLVTMFAVCAALAYPFLPFAAVVAAALAATVADGIKPVIRGYVIDDNLTIPVVASLAAYLALVGLGEVEAPVALVLG
jgi:dolichol kinase